MIRMKGDIIKQLNNLYIHFSFKERYKEELKERILNFFDSISTGTLTERLKASKELCIIENNEIKLLNQEFINKYKQELFNSFNPLWYKNRKEEKINDGSDLLLPYLWYKLISELSEKETINSIKKDFNYDQDKSIWETNIIQYKTIWETNIVFGKSLEYEKEILIKEETLSLKKSNLREDLLLEKLKSKIYFNNVKIKNDLNMILEYTEKSLNSFYEFLIPVKKIFKMDKMSYIYDIETKNTPEYWLLYNKDNFYHIKKTNDQNYFSIKSNNFNSFIFDNPFSINLQEVFYKMKKRKTCLLLIKNIINNLLKIKIENLKTIDEIIFQEIKKYPLLTTKKELI